ncbi:MAG: 3-phosphoserine/phosphohydroxythreonine transaminase [Kiritimatiellia bacterium]
MARAFNFCAGPAILPVEVLQQAQAELVDYQGSGMSIMEMSHRGKQYEAVHQEATANIRTLMNLTDDYAVLFLQGGASLQFAMVPMNFLPAGATADYVNAGSWGAAAVKQARLLGNINIAADCEKDIPTRVPDAAELKLTPGAAYLHLTSNETISGAQWKTFPQTPAPLICDMSSDILSRPVDYRQFGMVYAGAQKNLGPSGVTLVIVRKDMAEKAAKTIPAMLRYQTHVENDSLYNTPPCFSIYILALTTRWLKNFGLENMFRRNRDKAQLLYSTIDASGFYRGTARNDCRSDMNITFRLPTVELEERFCAEASKAGLSQLKGHRSVGGVRASIYNAFPVEGVQALVSFMQAFEKRNG